MTNERMDNYKMRIAQAGVGELTVIMLEMEIDWIEEAIKAYDMDDRKLFEETLDKAQMVQKYLMDVLNPENEVAASVYSVFVFINRQLLHSKIKGMPLDLDRCKAMLEKYLVSFREVAKTDGEGPIMATGEKVYAGLTYGTDGLLESSTGGMDFSV